MPIKLFCHICFYAIALLFSSSQPLLAQSRKPLPLVGMSVPQVLSIRGAPLEKIEYESLRQEKWRYADFELLFKNGTVLSIKNDAVSLDQVEQQAMEDSPQQKPTEFKTAAKPAVDQKKFAGVLDQILRELPSESGPADSSATAATNISPVEIIRQAQERK